MPDLPKKHRSTPKTAELTATVNALIDVVAELQAAGKPSGGNGDRLDKIERCLRDMGQL